MIFGAAVGALAAVVVMLFFWRIPDQRIRMGLQEWETRFGRNAIVEISPIRGNTGEPLNLRVDQRLRLTIDQLRRML